MPVSRRQFVALLAMAGAGVWGVRLRAPGGPGPVRRPHQRAAVGRPRDAVSNLRQAGLPELPLNDTSDPHVFTMTVTLAGKPVVIPAHVGVDRVRAVQAPVHTHDDSGQVWLEGRGNREVTLGQWFTLWGVRATDTSFGPLDAASYRLEVDGAPSGAGLGLVLRTVGSRLDVVVGEE